MPDRRELSGKVATVVRQIEHYGPRLLHWQRLSDGTVYEFEGWPGLPYARTEVFTIRGLYKMLLKLEETDETRGQGARYTMPSAWAEVRRQARTGNAGARDLWNQLVAKKRRTHKAKMKARKERRGTR